MLKTMNKKQKQKNGILLLVYGHPYYGRYAFNLAVSIKAVEFETFITVAFQGGVLSHLSEDQKLIFDNIIEIPEKINPGYGMKLQLDVLTPYENTIFLDSDTVWLPKQKPSELFAALEGIEFTGITEGFYDIQNKINYANPPGKIPYYYWADINEIIEVYKPAHNVYQWRSEFIYFTQTKKVKDFFKKAREIYRKPEVKSMRHFTNTVPDELAINIAAAIIGIEPHQKNWSPTYWPPMHKNRIPEYSKLYEYYLLSLGSNAVSNSTKDVYNIIMSNACRKLQYQYLFTPHNKKQFDNHRLKM